MARTLPTSLKLILDFAPMMVFFVTYKFGGMMLATALLLAATLLCLAIIYAVERTIALAPLLTGAIVLVFGTLTLLLKDESFIKLKPTLIYGSFAAILLVGVYGFRRGLLQHVLGLAVQLSDAGWLLLSRRWGYFFLGLAMLNELVWRNFSTDIWVDFKVFGMFALTILFALTQIRVMERYRQ